MCVAGGYRRRWQVLPFPGDQSPVKATDGAAVASEGPCCPEKPRAQCPWVLKAGRGMQGDRFMPGADQVIPHLCFFVLVAGLSLPLSFRAQRVSAKTNQGVAKVGFLSMQY